MRITFWLSFRLNLTFHLILTDLDYNLIKIWKLLVEKLRRLLFFALYFFSNLMNRYARALLIDLKTRLRL